MPAKLQATVVAVGKWSCDLFCNLRQCAVTRVGNDDGLRWRNLAELCCWKAEGAGIKRIRRGRKPNSVERNGVGFHPVGDGDDPGPYPRRGWRKNDVKRAGIIGG